jgi:hypothetical protein
MFTSILEQPAVQVKGMILGCDPFTSRTYLSIRTSSFYYDLNERLCCTLMYCTIHCIVQPFNFPSYYGHVSLMYSVRVSWHSQWCFDLNPPG